MLFLVMICVVCARAETFTFDLVGKDGASWDNESSGVYTNVGSTLVLEASLYAYLDGGYSANSRLNSGANDFGINAAGTGDEPLAFDTVNGMEAMWIAFDRQVTVSSLTVSSFAIGNVETGAYQVAAGNWVEFTESNTYRVDELLDEGSFFKITTVDQGGGNGWSLDSFAVEAIPEPVTLSFVGLAGIFAIVGRRISRK